MIGQTVAKNLFTNDENPIGQTIRFKNIPFKVIGVLTKKGKSNFGQDQDDVIIAPYTTVQKRNNPHSPRKGTGTLDIFHVSFLLFYITTPIHLTRGRKLKFFSIFNSIC